MGPAQDRPLAADLGAALGVLDGRAQTALLDAVLETDEPLILAQLLSFSPPALRSRIEQRITGLAPLDAGAIQSLTEMQARIDELLTAGAADAAARYMEAEVQLKTLGQDRVTGRLAKALRIWATRKLIRPVDPDRIATQFFAVVRGDLHMRALSGLLPDDLDKAMRRNVQGAVETFWPVLRPGGSYGT